MLFTKDDVHQSVLYLYGLRADTMEYFYYTIFKLLKAIKGSVFSVSWLTIVILISLVTAVPRFNSFTKQKLFGERYYVNVSIIYRKHNSRSWTGQIILCKKEIKLTMVHEFLILKSSRVPPVKVSNLTSIRLLASNFS